MDLPLLSPKERLILDLVQARGEMYGLEMVKASNGLKRGTIYVTLGRMVEKGYVESRQQREPGRSGLPRRLFRITEFGTRVLAAWTTLGRQLDPSVTSPADKVGLPAAKPVATTTRPRASTDASERARVRLNQLVDRMEAGTLSRRSFLRSAAALGVFATGLGSFVDPAVGKPVGPGPSRDDLRRSGLLVRVNQVDVEHGNAIEGLVRPNALPFWQQVYAGDVEHTTTQGRGVIQVDGKDHPVQAGEVLTIPMGQRFSYRPTTQEPWRFTATHPFWQPGDFTYGYQGTEMGGDEVWFEIKRSPDDDVARPALRLVPATERSNYTVVALDPAAETLGIRSPKGRMIITPITGEVTLRYGADPAAMAKQDLSRGALARVPPGAQFTIRNTGSHPAMVEVRPDPPRIWDPEVLLWEAEKGQEVSGDKIWFDLVLPA